ncbi:hypothetical protein [Deinococcus soli (ex Cha et al. 2016)]|uniref:Uncharacterized protein n=2 Tax=Deinococcus soli (ex Cha et al. 2016) TaxID=1309411 RepID=A0ACC6KDV0_9DEIO|nr:hypothetical protein [Deinococcus soli (ex Cha et al. 2016)]MDR6217240.1 hypothetical protein [Deinococcus soli (ex Cha et al. 2016)]MDR6326549.1 hypothetical protein [Deinococcus soli (ex Cha et al. 2016)]MDR6750724.1 hypothetical protein [Deinococcus soli (ex Cha et al. 2016)]
MTPDEWKTGMQNEASSVNDREWAMDTKLAAGRFGWRGAGVAAAVFAALGVGVVLLGQFLWRHDAPDQLWLGVMILSGMVGALLGTRRVGALEAGVGALAFLPGAWMTVVALQAVLGNAAPFTPIIGVSNEGVAVLAVIAACAAGSVRTATDRLTLVRA